MVLFLEHLLLAFVSLACCTTSMTQTSLVLAAHAASTSNFSDHLALMAFKSQVTSDPSRALATWSNQSVPMCQWQGVSCGLKGSRHGRVVALDLGELNLVGTVTPALGNLTYLRLLNLSSNHFHGILPPELDSYFEARNDADWGFLTGLTNSSNMRKLALSSNKLEGVLPNSIGNLSTQMKFLTIKDNKITGPIPEGIGNLINLNELDMGNNMLVSAIPVSLSKLKKLNRLSLSNNALSGPIPVSLGNLTELITLILGTNAISGAIPSSLSNCPLEVLDLSHNNLSGPIPKELFFISTLSKSMNLAHNSLSGPFPSEVGNLKNLNEIDLSNNMISGEIPTSIGECQSLENLRGY
ncbi:receptor kinase-like protein Xa21 [Miscanthus floridulus]|uniref:receptor kinase-like protein Xa21 n=1 Tax=Miscanthus floridulus TaxID=154761 RepID=UPI003458AE0F